MAETTAGTNAASGCTSSVALRIIGVCVLIVIAFNLGGLHAESCLDERAHEYWRAVWNGTVLKAAELIVSLEPSVRICSTTHMKVEHGGRDALCGSTTAAHGHVVVVVALGTAAARDKCENRMMDKVAWKTHQVSLHCELFLAEHSWAPSISVLHSVCFVTIHREAPLMSPFKGTAAHVCKFQFSWFLVHNVSCS